MSYRSDDEMDEELKFHLDQQTEEYIRAGMDPQEARRQASIKLGKSLSAREVLQDLQPFHWLDNTLQDFRYGLRGLIRNASFSITALLSISLGIAATVAIFTLADNILLRDLPYPESDRLVMVWEARYDRENQKHNVVSPANFLDWKAKSTAFESMAYFVSRLRILSSGERSAELDTQLISLDLMPMLGVAPVRGRYFNRQDLGTPDANSVIISHRLWQAWFGGQEDVIGLKVLINATPRTVVGVMPKGFFFRNREVDLWEPFELDPAMDYRQKSGRYMLVLAKLKRGVGLTRAGSEIQSIAKQLEATYPQFNKKWSANVESLHSSLTREISASLLVLLAAVGLLLAIACSNVANLLLARYAARKSEISVRLSLGASPWRLVRQVLAESLLLSLTGGLLGLLLARLLVSGLLSIAPKQIFNAVHIQFDMRVMVAALLISILCGLLFGIAPASMLLRSRLESEQRGGISSGLKLRTWLVAAEIALSVVLLVGAGLMFRSFIGLQSTNSGLDPENLLTFRVSLPNARYSTAEAQVRFYETYLSRLRQLPGISSTSAISQLPFQGMTSATRAHLAGTPPAKPGESLTTAVRFILPNYFQTMRIPLVAGRDFSEAENVSTAPLRFIVNESFVKLFMQGKDPLVQKVSVNMQQENPYAEIIGVVGDVKENSLDREPRATVYYPYGKIPNGSMVVVLRSGSEPVLQLDSARNILREMDSQIPLANPHTMRDVLADTYSRQRVSSWLLSAFSLFALMLAAVGIFGIQSYAVSERTREIGVRVALGATPLQIIRLILTRAVGTIAIGLTAGIAFALLLSSFIKSLLFGVAPHDPLSFAAVAVLLLLTGFAAAYIPARRAAHLDPVDALQSGTSAQK